MNQHEAKTTFLALGNDQQIRFLTLFAHNITIAARMAYPGQMEDSLVPEKLVCLNELEHTVTGQLMHSLDRDTQRYADDLFVEALFQRAKTGRCERDLLDAFAWSLQATPSQAC